MLSVLEWILEEGNEVIMRSVVSEFTKINRLLIELQMHRLNNPEILSYLLSRKPTLVLLSLRHRSLWFVFIIDISQTLLWNRRQQAF